MSNSQDVLLQATNLSLGYGTHTVLTDVNLAIHAGEFWFFLGQNGSGKTTLLRSILGLLQPETGCLQFNTQSKIHKRRSQIGFVPQRCDINPTLPLTVREFVALGLVGTLFTQQTQHEYLDWVLEKVDLSSLSRKNYWTLSGGQRQRALVARALVRRPVLLLLDEPTNNLDLPAEDVFLQTLTNLQRETDCTCLFVTHNLSLAERYATHIGLIIDGAVIAGPKTDVLIESNLDRVYGRGQRIHVHVASDRTYSLADHLTHGGKG